MRTTSASWVGAILFLLALGRVVAGGEGGHEGVQEERLGMAPKPDLWPRPVYSKDGLHIAYVTGEMGEKCLVVVDGQPGPEYRAVGALAFSPDGKRVRYTAWKRGKWFIVLDGEPGPGYDEILMDGVVFSPDSKHVAYAAQKGDKWFVVLDGQPGSEYAGIGERSLVFSSDGKRLAYWAKKPYKWFVVLDGQPGPEHDWVPGGRIVFSSDGKRVAYEAKNEGKMFVVLDGQPGPEYDGIIPYGPAIHPDGVVEYLAIRDGVLYRVKHVP